MASNKDSKKDKLNHPAKRLYFPKDWEPLQGHAGPLRQARTRAHRARMQRNG